VAALGLKSKIDDRRSERQIEKWIQLARQHVDNHSYGHAREALQNALMLRPKDPRAMRLLKEIETEEHEYVRLRREKTEMYQAAMNAWQNGEVSQALSQMKHVLDLDQKAPDASSPDAAGVYRSFYDKLRSEHEAINSGYADARRQLTEGHLANALEICQAFLAKYPGQAVFQALRFDIIEQQRQRLSAYIADVDRRLDAEADLDAKVSLVREALTEYPDEEHFRQLARLLADKRDLVNSIVERARVHESAGQFAEAIGDFETLGTIYALYPGLAFEKDRLQKRLQQHARNTARAAWVRQIDGQLATGDYNRASELLDKAQVEFPDDAELTELRKLAGQGRDRATRADQLIAEGQELCAQGQFEQGIDLLNIALQLDDRTSVRMTLRDLFVTRAQEALSSDWRVTGGLTERALELDPNHALAKSLRAQALDKKREAEVEQHASQSRRLQAAGDVEGAMAEVERGLSAYPGDTRLSLIADALRKELGRPSPPPIDSAPKSSAASRAPLSSPPPAPARETIEQTRLVPERRATPSPTPQAQEETTLADEVPPQRVAAATTAPVTPVPPRQQPRPATTKWLAIAAGVLLMAGIAGFFALRPSGPPAPSGQLATALPAPAPTPPAPVPPTAAPETPLPAALAVLSLQQLPPGTRVLLDETPIGTIGSDGSLTQNGISPGRHTLRFEGRGFEPLSVSQDFVSAQILTLSGADVKLVRAPVTVDVRADAGTEVTITQAGRTIQQLKASGRLTLAEGAYELAAKGPVGVTTTRPLTVSAGAPITIDARNLIVTGMERFDSAGWSETDSWTTRRGGNFVLYDRPGSQGTISFTIRLDRSGNPFSSGSRLNWVVGYADSTNYVLLQLDKDAFYRSVVTNGGTQPPTRSEHRIPNNVPYINFRVQLAGNRLVHEYSTQSNVWQTLDSWSTAGAGTPTAKREILDGRFGFFLPGAEEIAISNFYYYPPTPTR
jgi:tetratricopeptide (TPR) repeat protein